MHHDIQILPSGHISFILDLAIFQSYWSKNQPIAVNELRGHVRCKSSPWKLVLLFNQCYPLSGALCENSLCIQCHLMSVLLLPITVFMSLVTRWSFLFDTLSILFLLRCPCDCWCLHVWWKLIICCYPTSAYGILFFGTSFAERCDDSFSSPFYVVCWLDKTRCHAICPIRFGYDVYRL